jgi:hypothetical protein
MNTELEQIPGMPILKRKAGYNLPEDVLDDLADLRKRHKVNLSEFAEAAIRDALKRYKRRPPTHPTHRSGKT